MKNVRIWYHNILDSQRFVAEVLPDRVRVGRGAHNDIVLDSHFVAEEAAVLDLSAGRWQLHALGGNGCRIAERPVGPGECLEFGPQDRLEVFPFHLTFEHEAAGKPADSTREQLDRRMSDLIHAIHIHLLSLMDVRADDLERSRHAEYLLTLEHNIDEIGRLNGIAESAETDLVAHIAGQCVRQCLIEDLIGRSGRKAAGPTGKAAHWTRLVSAVPDREDDLTAVVHGMLDALDLREPGDLSREMETVDRQFWPCWQTARTELLDDFLLYLALREVKKQIKDIVFGYGPLEDLLRMPTINEIMVVRSDRIYIEKKGIVEDSGRRFISDDVTLTVIDRIVSQVGRRIDRSQPLVDARLNDGSRVNAVIPPLAVSGPCLTIRKFPEDPLTIEDLIEKGSLTAGVAEFLRAAVVARCNILIAGGTGTGKTTLLNCLSDFIPDKERIVSIEDTAELQLKKAHVIRLETKTKNVEGAGAYTIHDLVKNALRMRPDRIIVGECRGAEALDMLQAMNTGHDGSLTTIHANSPADVQLRLEVMVRSAADLPMDSVHRQIASAIDLIVQLTRTRSGARRVTQVTEVAGIDQSRSGLRMKDLFCLEQVGGQEQLMPTGRLPGCIESLLKAGYDLENFYR